MVLPNFKEKSRKNMRNYWLRWIKRATWSHFGSFYRCGATRVAHLIVKEAYALGAHEVIVQWTDDVINREKFLMHRWSRRGQCGQEI